MRQTPPRGVAALTAVLSAVALLGGLVATTTIASNVGRMARFDAVGALRSAAFDLGSLGVQPLLRADFVSRIIGSAFDAAPMRSESPRRFDGTQSDDTAAPPTTTTTMQKTLVGRLLTRDARLAARMVADRATVMAGEHITYSIILVNTGSTTIRGNVDVQSHLPVGTIDARRECDSDLGVNVDPEFLCVSPAVPASPGAGDTTHQVVIGMSVRLPPGQERAVSFRVRVADVVPEGTKITNHAHVDLLGDGQPAISTDPVVVVVSSGPTV